MNLPVAIVTGASSGIGKETAYAYARRGYAVVLAARRVDKLQEVAQQCRELSPDKTAAKVVPTDVSQPEQVEQLVQGTLADYGRIDVMVNNAGYGLFARVHETSDEQLRAIFDTNFYGVFYACRAVAPVMMRRRSGHIFNLSSVIGRRGTPFHGAYSATKFAITGLTESLRVEMMSYRVRVTNVCPALTETDFFSASQGRTAERKPKTGFWRRMTPAKTVANRIAAATGKDVPEIVFTAGGKMLVALSALWPWAADRMMKRYHDELVRGG